MTPSSKNKWRTVFGAFILLALSALFLAPGMPPAPASPSTTDPANIAWMLTATGLVLLMTPGLSFFYGGMVSKKNVISTMLQSFIALGLISIVWVVVGFSLAFGDSLGGLIGDPRTFFFFKNVTLAAHPRLGAGLPLLLFALFQLKFAIITPALITGSFAERVKFSAYLVFMVLFSLLIYAPLAHWTWHPDGIFYRMGILDFAGGTVVHMSAGFAAIAGAWVLGPRSQPEEEGQHTPARITYVLLGTGMLWFGWFGFNAGSALAADTVAVRAFATTNTASAAAMIAWIFFDAIRGIKVSAMGAAIGAVVGLVAITPAAGYVDIGPSIFIGTAAAIISNLAVGIKNKSRLDDTLDVFPCHGVGGITGMLLTGVFAREVGLIYGQTATFIAHLQGLLIAGVFSFGGAWLLYQLTARLVPLRVSAEEELLGLDMSQHNERL